MWAVREDGAETGTTPEHLPEQAAVKVSTLSEHTSQSTCTQHTHTADAQEGLEQVDLRGLQQGVEQRVAFAGE